MRRWWICFGSILTLVEARATAASMPSITLAIDALCPYVCAQDSKIDEARPGAYVETARHVAKMVGIEVGFRIMPLSRALLAVDQNEVSGLALVGKNRSDSLLLTSEAVAPSQVCFFKRAGDGWDYKSEASLKNKRLGLVQDYRYSFLKDYVDKFRHNPERIQFVTGSDPLRRNLSKLILKRIDLTFDNRWVADELLRSKKWDNKVTMSFCAPPLSLYTGFSFRFPKAKETAAALSEGFHKLKASGELKRIYANYGLAWEDN